MKRLLLLLLIISFACRKPNILPEINMAGGTTYPIERVDLKSGLATAIKISSHGRRAAYQYLDKNDSVIAFGQLAINGDAKENVFAQLGIEDLKPISFTTIPNNTYYEAFGNLIHLENESYAWDGRIGRQHIGIGRICHSRYNSLTRSFEERIIIPRTPAIPEIMGGSHLVINGTIYFFAAIYNSGNATSVRLSLSKSTDGLIGEAWHEETLLFGVGNNGGVNEVKFENYNFYGEPAHVPNTGIWIVPWFEYNNAHTLWRSNYIYTTDNFATWETRNISQTTTNKITETAIAYVGNNTLIALARQEAAVTVAQNVSYDLGLTWSGWKQTNLGSAITRTLPSLINTPEYGIIVVYADRGTGNMMISLNNDVPTILQNPLGYKTGKIIYTVNPSDLRQPLGYPSILRVSQGRYMIAFSEEFSSTRADVLIGDGSLKNYE